VVFHSLFEEQIEHESRVLDRQLDAIVDSGHWEATSYSPEPDEFTLSPDRYLEHVRRARDAAGIPIIASLNGVSAGGWLKYARLIEQAGADALELNVFFVATDPKQPAVALEARTVEMARVLKRDLSIPLALKLSPFFTSLPNLARNLESTGVAGMVLFNRFYERQACNVVSATDSGALSQPSELALRLRWLEVLSRTARKADLAVSGGVHSGTDALQSILAGASAVQVVSALLLHGVRHLQVMRSAMERWLAQHRYQSLEELRAATCFEATRDPQVVSSLLLHGVRHLQVMRDTMERWLAQHRYQSLEELRAATCFEPSRDPQVLSRASYMRILQSWHN